MKLILVLFLVFSLGCSTTRPTATFEAKRAQRLQRFFAEVTVSLAELDKLKEDIKQDYHDIMGPSSAFDEKMDLHWNNVLLAYILSVPGTYEKLVELSSPDPIASRDQIQIWIADNKKRIGELDLVIAREMQAAEQRATDEAERRAQIGKIVMGIGLIGLAVAAGAATGAAAARTTPTHTSFGNYPEREFHHSYNAERPDVSLQHDREHNELFLVNSLPLRT